MNKSLWTKALISAFGMLAIALLCFIDATVVNANYEGLKVEDGIIISYEGNLEKLAIPERIDGQKIVAIANGAFENNITLTAVEMPNTINYIGDNAFRGCKKLKKVVLSDNLESCGTYVFSDCISLEEIEIPGSLSVIGPNNQEGYVFNECSSLRTVIINEGVKDIGTYTFYKCSSLSKIILPQSLEKINTWSFGFCESLEKIELPKKLRLIGSAAFYECSALSDLFIPETVDSIGTHSFRGCRSLSTIKFSKEIKVIPYRAFSGCDSLEEVIMPTKLEAIDKEAFYQCVSLRKIGLSKNIISIGDGAFYQCSALESIEFPNSISSLGVAAFYECESLAEIELPANLTRIENRTFYGCKGIKRLVLSEQLSSIGSKAFYNCGNIVTLSIPQKVKKIEKKAFAGCNRLVEIYNFSSINLQVGNEKAGNVASYAMCIHTSSEQKTHLQRDDDGYIYFVDNARCVMVGYEGDEQELTLPDTFKGQIYTINSYAFAGDISITHVVLPAGIKTIEEGVFANCDKLYSIGLPRSLKEIKNKSFMNCTKLNRIYYEGSRKEWADILIGQDNDELPIMSISYAGEKINYSTEDLQTDNWKLSTFIEKNIFFVNFLLTLFWGVIFIYSSNSNQSEKEKQRRKLIFIIIVCAQWILISGLRADTVGSDTLNYSRLFDKHISWEWSEVISNLKNHYLQSVTTETDEYEPGYIFLEKLIGTFTQDHIVYQFVIATIFMVALGYYIYINSEDPCMSFVIYNGLFYNMFSLTGYRQAVSVALGVLLGYEFIKKKKVVPFLILIFFASLLHRSTLVFILFYFLSNKKLTKLYIGSALVIGSVMIVFRNQLFDYVKVIVGYEQYSGTYGFAQETFTILLACLTILAFYYMPKIRRYNDESIHYYNGLILMWMMMPFAMVSPTSMRLVYDFGFILLLLIPTLVKAFRNLSNRLILYWGIVIIFGYFILTKAPEYQFFWS